MDLFRSPISGTPGRTLACRATMLTLAAGLAASGAVLTATRAEAAAGPAWNCSTPLIFVAQGSPTMLETEQFTNPNGAAAFTTVSTAAYKYNSIGFDPIDDYVYGFGGPGNDNDLLRIDSTGTATDIGTPTNAVGNNGAFDPSGNFYIGGSNKTTIYRIAANTVVNANGTAGSVIPTTPIALSAALTSSDFTWDDGFLWGAGDDGTIQRIDPTTGTVTFEAAPTLAATTSAYGADWTYGDGYLGFSDNLQGNISRVQIINPAGAFTFGPVDVTAGPTSGNNDGAACSEPTDLAVTKTVNGIPLANNSVTAPAIIAPGSPLTWQVNGVNNGPGGSSQQFITDTLPAGVTAVTAAPSAGGTCTTPAAGAAFTCKWGYLASAGTRTIVVKATATTALNSTQNNPVTITGNEQDNVNNNAYTAYAQTYNPVISLVKNAGPVVDANNDGRVDAGDTIAYTFAVTNTGNVTLSTVGVTDPLVGAVNCPLTTLTPQQSTTCTAAAYPLKQADLDRGSVSNTATGTPAGGTSVTSVSSKVVTLTQTPSIALVKHAGAIADANNDGRADAGDAIAYTFTVTDTGTVTLNAVGVADSLAGAVTCPAATLTPNAQETCTANNPYPLTQAEVDAGSVSNTATANGTPSGGAAVSSLPSSTMTPIPAAPALGLVKHASAVSDANTDGRIDAGDTIAYTFTLTDTGNLSLNTFAVSDPLAGAVSCPAVTLTPGQATTCTATNPYVVTLANMNAGSVSNTATASAITSVSKAGVASGPSSTTTPLPATPAITLSKKAGGIADANNDGRADAGDTIAYTFTVTNTGSVTLTGVAVPDPTLTGVSCPNPSLDPGVSETCTAPAYSLTQADVNAGTVSNTATATGVPPGSTAAITSQPSTVVTPVPQTPTISLVKTGTVTPAADQADLKVGDTIAYTFVTRNTGTVTLTGVSVADSMADVGGVTCQALTLAPGASTPCSAATPHTVTQADIDAGTVANTATASGHPPTGAQVTAVDTVTLNAQQPAPAIALIKTATVSPAADQNAYQAGDTIGYTFLATNTGNLTLTAVGVNDPTIGAVTCPTTTLAPNASETCTANASHTVTQAEFDAQQPFVNTATVSGTPPRSLPPVTATSTATTPAGPGVPALAIVKSGTVTPGADQKGYQTGDTVAYAFLVTNTGNVTMTGVHVDDADPSVGATTCPSTVLVPGATTTCTTVASYHVSQANVDAGSIVNTATAIGTPPASTGIAAYTSAPSTVTLDAVAADPKVSIAKTATVTPSADQQAAQVGDTIAYTFVVTNTGNVTLTGVVVNDQTAGPVTCPVITLAPAAATTCAADRPRTVTQAEFDALQPLVNTATATGTPPQKLPNVTSDPSTATVPLAAPAPGITFVKAAAVTPAADQTAVRVGDTIAYSFVVTNTGNVTMAVSGVTDPLAGATTCPAATLAPGATETCTADNPYTVTQLDVDNGSVPNTATVGVTPPPGVPGYVPPTGSVTVPTVPAAPALALVKAASVTPTADQAAVKVGDTIGYSFLVTNTGNVTATDVAVNDIDPAVGPVTCPVTTLAPGAGTTCQATNSHKVTQAEFDARKPFVNVASATGTPPQNLTSITSLTSTVTVPLDAARPALSFVKSGTVVPAADQSAAKVGDTIDYTFLITNTGNVTMGITGVNDAKVGAVTCPAVTLAPGATETCKADAAYVVTQADVDAGSVLNTATLGSTSPAGVTPLTLISATNVVSADPAHMVLTLVKTARVTPTADQNNVKAGDTIVYAFLVTNTGNVTMNNVGVTDPTGSTVSCPQPSLAPGQSETCVSDHSHTVTAAEVAHASYLVDSATAHGTPVGGTVVAVSARYTVRTKVAAEKLHAAPAAPPAPSAPSMPLAFTGADTAELFLTGLTSLLIGLTLIGLARRRA